MLDVAVVGGSGYAGGELVRLLLSHPGAALRQVTSERNAGKFVFSVHPNLRKRTQLKFTTVEKLEPCDVLFVALPHGVAMGKMESLRSKAKIVIDLSADFRLNDPAGYPTWYDHDHSLPEMLGDFVYGIPELHRDEIRSADAISSAGCMATTAILGLYPLFKAGVVDTSRPTVIEAKTGSSGAGGAPGLASHHPERSGVIRTFKATGHRHSAEIIQECTVNGVVPEVAFSATSVEAVRGILATSHVYLKEPMSEKDVWAIYRTAYKEEPFLRIVKESSGIHRYPEPKILSGSNYCDIGFERDPHSNRLVVLAALDNLMKGAAGQAVQTFNIRCGYEETCGIDFAGLHPV
ncbi:MAG: LysW-gamma-L-alpha-aminoadipyl-6-phosphate/LysW-L-glutamyl-5-phosphate reductase [Thermomicrobiales bacterium]|nr:LysW-gamma-L-alpha-aminoadipyl-6-phosphate/LysW-L-glutamyl-5-phosphate reductase [Thermomicrobiales bacterium]